MNITSIMIWESFLDKTVIYNCKFIVRSWRKTSILPTLLDFREELNPGLKWPHSAIQGPSLMAVCDARCGTLQSARLGILLIAPY